jgi:hypothetical protein
MYTFQEWSILNKKVLKDLYFKLINISETYGLTLIKGKKTYQNFIIMMYHKSNKEIIYDEDYEEDYIEQSI